MFYSVLGMIVSLCTHPPMYNPNLPAKDRFKMGAYQYSVCVDELNTCTRKKLKGKLAGWRDEQKEDAISFCVQQKRMFIEWK